MREGREIRRLGDILIFDKRFNGLPKGQQDRIAHFTHVSAEELKSLKVDDGDVKLISTGQFDGYTTKDLAGGNLNRGEIITIPTGGAANIKYYSGFFVDSGNLIGIARDASLCPKYVYFGMTCKKDEINSYYRGVSIKHPFMPDICKITLPFPSVQEQEKIVAELDCLTGIIEKKKQQLEELDKLAQSIFYDMFGDPITNEKRWEMSKVGDCMRVIGGYAFKSSSYSNSGYRLVQIANVWKDVLVWDDITYISFDDNQVSPSFILKKGDVLMAMTRPVIKSLSSVKIAVVREEDTPCLLNQRVCKFVSDGRLSIIWFYNFARTEYFKDNIVGFGSKGMQPNVSAREIESIKMFLPPRYLQDLFAKKIEAIECQKELIKKSIQETETLFNSRMDYWFNN